MAEEISNRILERIREIFPESERNAAKELLLRYQSASAELNERIYLDILRICEGKIDKLKQLVELAQTDYRDLIVAAEYDCVDGKYVLKAGLKSGWWKR